MFVRPSYVSLSQTRRYRALAMPQLMKDYLKEFYYDPKFHGLDLDARFKISEEKIKRGRQSWAIVGAELSAEKAGTLFPLELELH